MEVVKFSKEQVAKEDDFMKGIPRLNLAAFLLPPIWGPAHGFWVTILFYPIWIFADNTFYAAYSNPTFLSLILALLVFVVLVALTAAFSILGQPFAAHRAAERGKTKEEYLRRQRQWAVGCAIAGCVLLIAATYYNLAIRPGLDA